MENRGHINPEDDHGEDDSHEAVDPGLLEDTDEEEIPMTSKQVLEAMDRAWMNEKFALQILPYEEAIVDMVMSQLVYMEENLATTNKNDLLYIAHRMEVERIRYVLASYHRCRLQKIEEYTFHILEEESKRPEGIKRLSAGELKFAKDFHESVENHFQEVAIKHMPQSLRPDDHLRKVVPNLDSYVFVKAKGNLADLAISADHETINIAAGSVHMFKYRDVEPLVLEDKFELI
ncbi:DNA replication complex GINS protein SLD5 [Toxorhynchites rutilus septentrionalis]|uniref:DNA replication complex GINS protein SLD5 n=1 Tax=Toxorhynchites rutilus septentrionalis TaxID=329112 RepID=UPI00247A7014|nr:DNA replication complex GINS protein SLD5 [Toxorhynchites rutilus septentrionalis]